MPYAKKVKGFYLFFHTKYGDFESYVKGSDRIEAIREGHRIAREHLFLFISDYDLVTKAVF